MVCGTQAVHGMGHGLSVAPGLDSTLAGMCYAWCTAWARLQELCTKGQSQSSSQTGSATHMQPSALDEFEHLGLRRLFPVGCFSLERTQKENDVSDHIHSLALPLEPIT